ncbi:MAG: hypothetical protein M1835_001710 [Candelina submexicana]|nr:MAG: hypothetical protein M1835_001710 [Candelina submexicana]
MGTANPLYIWAVIRSLLPKLSHAFFTIFMTISSSIRHMPSKIINGLLAAVPGRGISYTSYLILAVTVFVTQFLRLHGHNQRNRLRETTSITIIAVWMLICQEDAWLFFGVEESLQWAWLGYQLYQIFANEHIRVMEEHFTYNDFEFDKSGFSTVAEEKNGIKQL